MSTTFMSRARRCEIADQLGVSEQYLYQCLTGRREMSAQEALRAEVETGGELSRKMLRRNTWQAIWPELAEPEGVTEPATEGEGANV